MRRKTQGKAEWNGMFGVSRLTRSFKKIWMPVRGFRMEVGLDLVIDEMNLFF